LKSKRIKLGKIGVGIKNIWWKYEVRSTKYQVLSIHRGGKSNRAQTIPLRPPRQAGLPAAGRALRHCEKTKSIWRAKPPRRKEGVFFLFRQPACGRWTSTSLRPPRRAGLFVIARRQKVFGAQSRQGAKKGCFSFSVSLPVVGGPVFLCVSAPLRDKKKRIRRGGKSYRAHYYFFAPSAAGRPLRLCEKKSMNPPPAILRDRYTPL
jgi:hypothetical protein